MQENEKKVDVAIIGAGTAGGNAMKQVQASGKTFVLIDQGPLGTTCARVGCMPSKAVLHAGAVWHARHAPPLAATSATTAPDGAGNDEGIADADAGWRGARSTRDMLAAGAAARTRAAAGEHLVMSQARFLAPDLLQVGEMRIRANAVVIATGSTPVVPAFLTHLGDRLLTTDSLFEQERLPASIGIIGMGAIGLEMALGLSRLGVRVVGIDLQETVGGISDPEVAARALAHFSVQPNVRFWLGESVTAQRTADGVELVRGSERIEVDVVLAALGRRPLLDALQLECAGVRLKAHAPLPIDPSTMRLAGTNLFFAGDAHGDRPLLHEAADEGAIAGWNAAHPSAAHRFRRRVPMAILFSDPDVASIGAPLSALDPQTTVVGTATGQSNGRSRIIGAGHNLIRLYADRADGRLLGASLLATRGEHLAHLLAWAIARGETAESLLEMPFYHPTIEEMLPTALSDIVRQQHLVRSMVMGLRDLGPETPANA